MRWSAALPSVVALVLGALAAPAAEPACRGTLSGSVKAEFACSAGVVEKDGAFYLVIDATGPIPGVPGCAPGSFELPRVAAGTYTLDTLGMGRASVAAEGGTLYTATKTTGQRGEVTLILRSAARSSGERFAYRVHGTYRARLVPAGAGKTGEVVVEVAF
jgi:hypothetical protein